MITVEPNPPYPVMNFDFLESVLNAFAEPVYVIRVVDYQIVLANQAARALGVKQAKTCYALTHKRSSPCDGIEHPCPMKLVLSENKSYIVEHIHFKPDGSPYFAEVHGYPLYNDQGAVEYMVEYSINITERKAAEEKIRLLQRAFEFSGSGIVITGTTGRIEHVNAAFLRMTGYSEEEVLGQNPRILKSGTHSPEFYANLWETILKGDIWQGEMTNRRKDGSIYWEHQTIAPVRNKGQVTHFVAIKDDVTARKTAEQELERIAYLDPLTGLANRRHFFRSAEIIFSSLRLPAQMSAVMMDIDHFKNVNDQYGHAVGDEVLQEVAARLNRSLRPNDLIGRYGGEEFSLILSRVDAETACRIAERLRLAICEKPVSTQAGDLSVTISIGLACHTENTHTLDKLLQAADDALYQAKRAGRNQYAIYQVK